MKGYEFHREKIGRVFEFDGLAEPNKADAYAITAIREGLDDEACEAVAVARRVGHTATTDDVMLVLVLDDDHDLEKLRGRSTPEPLHWTIQRMMAILDGPHLYQPII